MAKVTNAVLAQKIDTLSGNFKDIKTDVKNNTEFRIQVRGFMAAITMFAGLLGGATAWVLNRFFPK